MAFADANKTVEISKRNRVSSCDARHNAVTAYTFVLK